MKTNRNRKKKTRPVWSGVLLCAAAGIFGILCVWNFHGISLDEAAARQEELVTGTEETAAADSESSASNEAASEHSPAATEAPTTPPETAAEDNALAAGYFVQPAEGVLTSAYGVRWGRNHNGIDIGADMGADVYAADGGVVTYADVCQGYGNYIIIDHQNGYQTAYGHLNEILVTNGEAVTQGQLIGKVGNTGNSTGPHLHFEIKADGSFLDPLEYVVY